MLRQRLPESAPGPRKESVLRSHTGLRQDEAMRIGKGNALTHPGRQKAHSLRPVCRSSVPGRERETGNALRLRST